MHYTIDGLKLNCETLGPERGEPILLIHGFPLSGAMWRPLAELLRDDFRLIIPDLRGFGVSEASDDASMARYADDCAALLDAVGERRPVAVAGMSMGGYIAFEFLRRARARVSSLVLVDTRPGADGEEARQGRFATAGKVLAQGSAVVADAMAEKLFAPGAPADLKKHWRDAMAGANPRGVAAALKAMARRADSSPDLKRIDVPALIIVGRHDAITPPAESEAMHRAIRGSTLETIPDAGHMAPVEQPRIVADALRRFLPSR